MSVKRVVDTQFWNDDKVVDLFSPEDKLFMLYLMTNPHTTQLGIYAINEKVMAFELGYSVDAVNVLLDRFENKYKIIKYCKETKEIAIKNYLKYSIIKGGKPVEDLLTKEVSQVKNKELMNFVYENVMSYSNTNESVKKIFNKYNENNNDNDNDNDNEDTLTYRGRIVKDDLDSVKEKYESIKEKTLENKENNLFECEWCHCKTGVIHNHHYPIPKRLGGTETVSICSNCHAEFHKKENMRIPYKDIVDYLNSKTNQNYKPTTNSTRKHIKARIEEGFTLEDFKKVIDNMCSEWYGNDMQKYLRPETLFGTKFESYLNREVKKDNSKLPDWWDKDFKERERSDEEERELQELIRGY